MNTAPPTTPSRPMPAKLSIPIRFIIFGLLIVAAGIVVTALAIYGTHQLPALSKRPGENLSVAKARLPVELVEEVPHTLIVPEDVRKALDIQESIVVHEPTQARPLVMPGSTALDPARVMRVRTRFNAEVVEITEVPDETQRASKGQTVLRELRPGDRVQKGQVLAVVWSIDVGARKSDVVDALVQLRLDEKRLAEREKLYATGSLPLDTLLQTRRDVVSDRNAKERAERTLRTWNIPDHEIKAVYDEAELAAARQGKRDEDKEQLWARSELIAPRDGIIVECNVSVGEYVADNTINLFTIAEVDRLQIIANPPEDQLPALLALQPGQMHWTLQTVQTAGAAADRGADRGCRLHHRPQPAHGGGQGLRQQSRRPVAGGPIRIGDCQSAAASGRGRSAPDGLGRGRQAELCVRPTQPRPAPVYHAAGSGHAPFRQDSLRPQSFDPCGTETDA